MKVPTYKIHWLSFTVHDKRQAGIDLHQFVFKDYIGPLSELGHGGRGFREILQAGLAFKLYLTPINLNSDYFHFEIPGKACDVIPNNRFFVLLEYLEDHHAGKYKFKRVDLAIDNVLFEPKQFEKAIIEEKARTHAKRETLKIFNSPFEKKDTGDLGTYTVQLGSNQSERMITVYNKRGFTRLEFQVKDKRADLVVKEMLTGSNDEFWFPVIISHLLDFIDIKTDWWTEFVNGEGRANKTVTTPREITATRLIGWLINQVSPALSAVNDAVSDEIPDILIKTGRKRRSARYDLLFRDYGPKRSQFLKKPNNSGEEKDG